MNSLEYTDSFREAELFLEEDVPKYSSSKDFVSLVAWQKCRNLKILIYKEVLPCLPKEETYALGSQIRRAAISTTANIAEGYGRYHYKEGIQYYRISRGSIYELKDHLISCFDLAFIGESMLQKALSHIAEAKITLNGFIHFVQRKIQEETSNKNI